MAIITQYPLVTPAKGDYIVGSQLSTTGKQVNPTKNFTVANVVKIGLNTIPAYDDNAAAVIQNMVYGWKGGPYPGVVRDIGTFIQGNVVVNPDKHLFPFKINAFK